VEQDHAQQQCDRRVEVGNDGGPNRAGFADQREEQQEAERGAHYRKGQDRQKYLDTRHGSRQLRDRNRGIEQRGQHQ